MQVFDHRLGAHELGARLDQRRLQRGHIVGKMISCPSHDRHISTSMLIRATNLAS
jgi:hypothetical protein